jgi:hypothetical protein
VHRSHSPPPKKKYPLARSTQMTAQPQRKVPSRVRPSVRPSARPRGVGRGREAETQTQTDRETERQRERERERDGTTRTQSGKDTGGSNNREIPPRLPPLSPIAPARTIQRCVSRPLGFFPFSGEQAVPPPITHLVQGLHLSCAHPPVRRCGMKIYPDP